MGPLRSSSNCAQLLTPISTKLWKEHARRALSLALTCRGTAPVICLRHRPLTPKPTAQLRRCHAWQANLGPPKRHPISSWARPHGLARKAQAEFPPCLIASAGHPQARNNVHECGSPGEISPQDASFGFIHLGPKQLSGK